MAFLRARTEQFSVSVYVGSSKNLKDLKGLTAGQRRAVAARDLADAEEEWAALAAPGAGVAVVQAYPAGWVVRRTTSPHSETKSLDFETGSQGPNKALKHCIPGCHVPNEGKNEFTTRN